MHLSSKKPSQCKQSHPSRLADKSFLQGKKAKSAESQAAMAAWEAPPAIMQYMMVRFRTNINRDQLIFWHLCFRLAACDQVWSWAARGIFNDICYECSEDDANGKTEDGDVDSMGARLNYNSPEDYYAQGH